MAIVKTLERAPSLRTWCTVALSTNADGVTGGDIADLGGLSLCGMAFSTGLADGSFSLMGSIDSSTNMQPILSSSGAVLAFGSSGVGANNGRTVVFDLSPYAGLRFVQVIPGSSGAVVPQNAGQTVKLLANTFGPNR